MQYRELARTGLRISEIGLGCEGFSGKTQAEATAWIHTALASVVVSVYTMEELQDCLHYEQASAEERDYAMARAKRDAPSAWRSANTCAQPKKSFVNKKERENI